MSSTYSANDALLWAKGFLKNMPLENVRPQILDAPLSRLWMAVNTSWTLGNLPSFILKANTAEYSVAIPEDFAKIVDAQLVLPNGASRVLTPVGSLAEEGTQKGQPSQIAAYPDNNFYRLHPIPGSAAGEVLSGLYKKNPPKITLANYTIAGAIIIPDQWFWAYAMGVLAYAYMWGDDGRAGQYSFQGGQYTATGAWGQFESAIKQMADVENIPLADPKTAMDPKQEK